MGRHKKLKSKKTGEAWKCGHKQCQADRKEIERLTSESMQLAAELVEARMEAVGNRVKARHAEGKVTKLEEQNREAAKSMLAVAHDLIGE
jgi:uncharacterized protein (UPF0335 family)